MADTIRTRNLTLLSLLGQGLKQQFELQRFCDVTLTTTNPEPAGGTESVECHKVVLSATSSFFGQYLTDNNNAVNIIDVSPISTDALRETLSFMYNGECLLHESNVVEILDASIKWGIPTLTEECFTYIRDAKSVDNACKFYEVTSKYTDEATSATLNSFIRKHFNKLLETEQLSKLSLPMFNTIISSDEIKVSSEDIIFDCAVALVKESTSAEDITRCWELIRFEHMSVSYLVGTVMYHEFMKDPPQNEYVKNAVESRCNMATPDHKRSCRVWGGHSLKEAAPAEHHSPLHIAKGTFLYINDNGMVCSYDMITKTWKELMKAPKWIDSTSAICTYPSGLIVVGSEDTKCGHVSLLDLVKQCKVVLPDLPVATRHAAVVYVGDTIFVIGGAECEKMEDGSDEWQTTDNAWSLPIFTDGWEQISSITNFVDDLNLTSIHNNLIFSLGGFNGPDEERHVQQYNITTGKWRQKASLPFAINSTNSGVVVYDKELIVITEEQALMFDDRQNRWLVKQYDALKGLQQAMIYDGEIHACLNNDGKCKIMKYDLRANKWIDTEVGMFLGSKYSRFLTVL